LFFSSCPRSFHRSLCPVSISPPSICIPRANLPSSEKPIPSPLLPEQVFNPPHPPPPPFILTKAGSSLTSCCLRPGFRVCNPSPRSIPVRQFHAQNCYPFPTFLDLFIRLSPVEMLVVWEVSDLPPVLHLSVLNCSLSFALFLFLLGFYPCSFLTGSTPPFPGLRFPSEA